MVDRRRVSRVLQLLRVLNNPTIRNIIRIFPSNNKPINVTQIEIAYYRRYGKSLTQPEISQQLAKLRKFGLVKMVKDGKYHLYCLDLLNMAIIKQKIENFNEAIGDPVDPYGKVKKVGA